MINVKTDIKGIVAQIRQISDRAYRGVSDVMRQEAEVAAELAKNYAPVDEHNLERAIKVRADRTGINGRYEVDVYVDEDMPAVSHNRNGSVTKGTEDKTVGEYAAIMHEGLAPYGSGAFNLGPESLRKAGYGYDVGGKFLTRALDEIEYDLIVKAQSKVREVTK